METYQLLAPLSFIIISLMVGAILKVLLKKTNSTIPYTVGLFAFGIIIGLLDTKWQRDPKSRDRQRG